MESASEDVFHHMRCRYALQSHRRRFDIGKVQALKKGQERTMNICGITQPERAMFHQRLTTGEVPCALGMVDGRDRLRDKESACLCQFQPVRGPLEEVRTKRPLKR